MLHRAHALRSDALQRLRDHRHATLERADLYVAAGRLSGILAYAALDLGDADAALEHARAAGRCARHAGDLELLMWVRGTQSLIARFKGDYGVALDYVRDGLQYAGDVPGTGEARLLCGEVQCLANLGDSRAANRTLRLAEQAREKVTGPDSLAGLFEFSETKQRYYAASSLIWLDGGDDARTAATEAEAAIAAWEQMPTEQRSLDDERLAHIYLATARVQLGEVEAAAEAMAPVLTLPAEAQISWINKRAHRIGAMLSAPQYRTSAAATALRESIGALGA
jgi:ATP/maltotriose-dependent transcriptional regulator MalT